MVDPQTLAQNIFLLIAAALFAGVGFVVVVVLWTTSKAALWLFLQRRSWSAFQRRTRRADGKKYPVQGEGFCDVCGEYSKVIYYPSNAGDMCPACYDHFWRAERAFRMESDVVPPQPIHKAASHSDKKAGGQDPHSPGGPPDGRAAPRPDAARRHHEVSRRLGATLGR